MVARADRDGCTYVDHDMYYSKEKGFHEQDGTAWGVHAFGHHRDGLNIFIHLDEWEKVVPSYTMDDLYEMLGGEFRIIR